MVAAKYIQKIILRPFHPTSSHVNAGVMIPVSTAGAMRTPNIVSLILFSTDSDVRTVYAGFENATDNPIKITPGIRNIHEVATAYNRSAKDNSTLPSIRCLFLPSMSVIFPVMGYMRFIDKEEML